MEPGAHMTNVRVRPGAYDPPPTMPAERPGTLDAAEIAALFSTSKHTVQRWARREDFPRPVDVLSRNRRIWPADEVERWAAEHLVPTAGKRRELPRSGRPRKRTV